ncbi:MAG: GAF domain-containing protein, partial [Rubrivivax sp.]|nr:GAF domain-containing protein [Rubrivivax sp.]
VLVPDTRREPAYPAPGHGSGYHSVLCVPIQYEAKPLGVINLESEMAEVFTEHHQRFLLNLAGHAAIALARARLFASNQRQIEFLDAIRRLSMDLLGAPNMEAVLEQVCTVALELVGALNIHLYFYDDTTDELTFAASLWRDGRRNVEAAIPRPGGLTRQGLQAGRPLISEDVEKLPGIPTRMLGVFPLKRAGQTVGVLNAAVEDPAQLGPDEVRALELLTNQAAIAIERVRLFESRQRQIEILHSLRQLSLELLDTLKLDTVLEVVCGSAMAIVPAEDVHLYLYDERADRLTFAASLWKDGRRDVEAMTPRPDGVTYRTAHSGRPTVIQGKELQAVSIPGVAIEAVAGIPLIQGRQVLGVLNVAVASSSTLDENQLHALELLANQAAVAIRNVGLYEQVRSGRDRLQAILNTIGDGLVLVDNNGYLLQVNPAAEDFLGVDIRPYVGQHILRVRQALARQVPRLNDIFTGDSLKELWRSLRRDPHQITQRQLKTELYGEPLYVEETSAPVLSEDGQPLGRVFVWHDVTEAHMLEETRAELTYTIVHDLRSPLTAIKSGLSMLQELGLDPPDYQMTWEIVQVAESSADSLLVMVESLLDVARMEREDLPLDLAPTFLSQPLEQAMKLLKVLARDARVTLITDLPDDLPPLVMDTEKIRRVFVNLLDNALRYTPSGGEVRVTAQANPGQNAVLVTVEDTGPGIPPELRERIFEKFTTGITGQAARGSRKGLGLGLAFCRLAIEAHKGRIWVEDSPKGGAAFRFVLPTSPEMSMMQQTLVASEVSSPGETEKGR